MTLLLLIAGLTVAGFLFLVLLRVTERAYLILFAFPVGSGLITLFIYVLEQAGLIALSRTSICLTTAIVIGIELLWAKRAAAGIFPSFKRALSTLNPRPWLNSWWSASGFAKAEIFLLLVLGLLAAVHCAMLPITYWDTAFQMITVRTIAKTGHVPSAISPDLLEFPHAYPFFAYLVNAFEHVMVGRPSHFLLKMLPPLYAVGIMLLLYHAGRRLLRQDRETALGALVLLCTCETFLLIATESAFDSQFNFFCIGGACLILEGLYDRENRSLWLGGILLGFAFWTNYKGLAYLAAVSATLFALTVIGAVAGKRGEALVSPGGLARVVGGAAAVSFPHLLRNWLLSGNPVYPTLYTVFGGRGIDAWSIKNLLSYHFPRGALDIIFPLDIFNSAFCVLIFFIIALSALGSSRRAGGRFFIAGTAGLYWLTWFFSMRIEDVDVTHYCLPAVVTAALLGGHHFSRFLRGRLRWSTLTIVLIALGVWWCFQFWLESAYFGYVYVHRAYHSYPGLDLRAVYMKNWRVWMRTADVLVFDFYELLLIPAAVLAMLARRSSLARYRLTPNGTRIQASCFRLPVLFYFASLVLVFSLSYNTVLTPLVNHLDRAFRSPAYSLVEDFSPRWLEPEGPWMIENLPDDALLFTFNDRRYLIPREVCLGLTTRLKDLYGDITIDEALDILRERGITHIHLDSSCDNYPLWGKSVIFDKLDDGRYFTLLFEGENVWEARKVRIYKIIYEGEGPRSG